MPGWVLAIDFGTSYSTAAIAQGGEVTLVEIMRQRTVPSGVWVDDDGVLAVGVSAERQGRLSPERWVRAPKRHLGEPAPLLLGTHQVQVVDAVASILRMLSAEAVRQQGSQPDEVRLTCPAQWGARRRGALLVAAQMAGLGPPTVKLKPRLVDEPVAAAVYFADRGDLPLGQMIAVYDLGGGTFDAAVLEATTAGFAVQAVGGVDGVGGERFDALLYAHVGGLLAARDPSVWASLQDPPDQRWRRAGEDLLREVRRGKEELSDTESVTLDTGPIIDMPVNLTRAAMEAVLRPSVDQTAEVLAQTIERAGLTAADLDAVYLAGGASRMPLVEQVVSARLGVPARVLGEPKSVVSLGGARWTEGAEAVLEEPLPKPVDPPLPRGAKAAAAKAAEDPALPAAKVPLPPVAAAVPPPPPAYVPPPPPAYVPPPPPVDPQSTAALGWAEQPTDAGPLSPPPGPPPAPRTSRKPVLIGVAALVAVGALTAGVLTLTGGSDKEKVSAEPSDSPSPTRSPRPSRTPRSSPTPDSVRLSTVERTLLNRLQPNLVIASTCVPERDSEDGVYTIAAITCKAPNIDNGGPSRVTVFQDASTALLNEDIGRQPALTSLPVGQCNLPPKQGTWSYRGTTATIGKIFCFEDTTKAEFLLLWTYDKEAVAVLVAGDDPAEIYQWWQDNDGLGIGLA